MKTIGIRLATAVLLSFCIFGVNSLFGQCAVGTIESIIRVNTVGFPEEISWELLDSNAVQIAAVDCNSYTLGAPNSTDSLCLVEGAVYTFNAFDDWGDGWNGGTYSITVDGAFIQDSSPNNGVVGDGLSDCDSITRDLEETFSFVPGDPISGCTDPLALNFNSSATVDDGSCGYPSPNDDCANAVDLAVGDCYLGNLAAATFNLADTASIDPTCLGLSGGTALDVWFTATVPFSGNLQIDLPSVPGITSTLQFLRGSCDSLQAIAALACTNYGPGASIALTALTPGEVLLIRYFDFGNNDEGTYEICLSDPSQGCTDPCAANYNPIATVDDGSCAGFAVASADDCTLPTALAGPGTYSFYSGASTGVASSSCGIADSNSIWFSYFVSAGIDSLLIYTCGSNFDTDLSIWDSCGGTEISCNDDGATGGGSTCGGFILQSYLALTDSTLLALEGSTILIRLAGQNGQSGCGELVVFETGEASCTAAASVANLTAAVGATAVSLNWDPVPASIGCLLNYGPVGGSFAGSFKLLGSMISTINLPSAVIPSGSYQIRVRCACQISPTIIATGYSDTAFFTIAAPKLQSEERLLNERLQFANPARDELQLSYNSPLEEEVCFSVINGLGIEQSRLTTRVVAGQSSIQIGLTALPSGMYFLRVTGPNTYLVMQFEHIK